MGKTIAKKPVEQPKVVEKPKAVAQVRFQGKIKSREVYKTTADGNRVRARGNKMNFGFIEVNPKDMQALRELPEWNSDLAADVFWHWKDCRYVEQLGGDIVTFT